MTRFKMPPKPRLPFCWECSRRLYGTVHAIVVVDGIERIVHKACAERVDLELAGGLCGPKRGDIPPIERRAHVLQIGQRAWNRRNEEVVVVERSPTDPEMVRVKAADGALRWVLEECFDGPQRFDDILRAVCLRRVREAGSIAAAARSLNIPKSSLADMLRRWRGAEPL